MGIDISTGIGAVADLAHSLIDRLIPDKAKAAELKAQIDEAHDANDLAKMQMVFDLAKAQVEVNKAEAGNGGLFVAGWRPFCGWVGGFGLAYVGIIEPAARFIAQVGFHYAGAFPAVDTTISMQILFGMLGLGAMRSYDKVNGAPAGH